MIVPKCGTNSRHFFVALAVGHTVRPLIPHPNAAVCVFVVWRSRRPQQFGQTTNVCTVNVRVTHPLVSSIIKFTIDPSTDGTATLIAILIIQPSQESKMRIAIRRSQITIVALTTSGASFVPCQRLVKQNIRSVVEVIYNAGTGAFTC